MAGVLLFPELPRRCIPGNLALPGQCSQNPKGPYVGNSNIGCLGLLGCG
jgi:hypothetical protein